MTSKESLPLHGPAIVALQTQLRKFKDERDQANTLVKRLGPKILSLQKSIDILGDEQSRQ